MSGLTSDTESPGPNPPALQIDARKRADQVKDRLVQLIREGYLKEGEKLPTEPQLSSMFGVGRSSIREAVRALIGLGMIEMRPGKGAYIRRLSLNDVVRMVDGAVRLEYGTALQLHEVRAMMEITAARLAATRRTDQDLIAMRDAIIRYRIADQTDNSENMIDADIGFHAAIVNATNNEVFVSLFTSILGLLREHRRQYAMTQEPSHRGIVLSEHDGLFEAISASDHYLAARRMQSHMRKIWRQIEQTAIHENGSTLDGQAYLPMYEENDNTD